MSKVFVNTVFQAALLVSVVLLSSCVAAGKGAPLQDDTQVCEDPQGLYRFVYERKSGDCVETIETIDTLDIDDIDSGGELRCDNQNTTTRGGCSIEINTVCTGDGAFASGKGKLSKSAESEVWSGELALAQSSDGAGCQSVYQVTARPL